MIQRVVDVAGCRPAINCCEVAFSVVCVAVLPVIQQVACGVICVANNLIIAAIDAELRLRSTAGRDILLYAIAVPVIDPVEVLRRTGINRTLGQTIELVIAVGRSLP